MKTRNSVGRGGVEGVPCYSSAGKLFSLFLFPQCRFGMFAKIERSYSKFPWLFISWNW